MINLEEYSDEDYILYQVANWAMLGLVDIVNLDYDFKFYSFLDELFNTNEISGEPGWFIEKIECDKNLDFLKTNDQTIFNKIRKLKEQGGDICFWVNSSIHIPEDAIFTEKRFWFVVKGVIVDFIESNPEYSKQYELFKVKYSEKLNT